MPRTLKIAHQYPAAASAEEGDFRDRICKRFAAEVERRTNGALRFEIFPENALVKPDKQLEALQKGTVDLCVMPLYNILEKVPEMNLTLLPGLVKSYEHGFRWKEAPVGRDLTALLEKNGAIMLTWNWQAGGIASKYLPILEPDNLRDVRIRGPGKAVDSCPGGVPRQGQHDALERHRTGLSRRPPGGDRGHERHHPFGTFRKLLQGRDLTAPSSAVLFLIPLVMSKSTLPIR